MNEATQMRKFPLALGLLILGACAASIPESGAVAPGADALAADAQGGPGLAGISDENDFQAVAARETIESDAARIAANRARYEVVVPGELPARPENRLSLVVEFALATTNPRGQPLYRRPKNRSEARFLRNCAKYTSSDLAQEDFLRRGGPRRDPRGLDPDGDGFACYWDPEPFRQARRAVQAALPGPAGETAGDDGQGAPGGQ